jgi:hypothetical protein
VSLLPYESRNRRKLSQKVNRTRLRPALALLILGLPVVLVNLVPRAASHSVDGSRVEQLRQNTAHADRESRLAVLAEDVNPKQTAARTGRGTETAAASVIRQFQLSTNDIVYDPVGQMLYASVPSRFGSTGNTVMQINPKTLTVGSPIFVGSEPGKMSVSYDGKYLYVGLDGPKAVRRVDLNTQSAAIQFWLVNLETSGGAIRTIEGASPAADIDAVPGQSDSVAIPSHGPTIYRDGKKLPVDLGPAGDDSIYNLTFSSSPSILYGINLSGDFLKYAVDDNGVSLVKVTPSFELIKAGNGTDIAFGGGLIYTTNGLVIDPEVPKIVNTFSLPDFALIDGLAPDPQTGRLYVLAVPYSCLDGCVKIYAFNLKDMSFVDSIDVPGITGHPRSFIRWGSNGFAFRTTDGGAYGGIHDQVFVIRSSLVPSAEPVDLPNPTQLPRLDPPTPPSTIRQISLPNDDLIYDQLRGLIYASVPGYAGANGNSITPINPATGDIGIAHNIGINPGKLAISRDDQYLYAAIISEHNVRRFNLQLQAVDAEFDIQSTTGQATYVTDMAVMPDDPTTAVVATASNLSLLSQGLGILVYKDGTVLKQKSGAGYTVVKTSDEPSVFYGAGPGSYAKYEIGLPGFYKDPFSPVYICGNMVGGYGDVQWANGLLFDNSGRVADPQQIRSVGTFMSPPEQPVLLADAKSGHVYFLHGSTVSSESTWTLSAFDMQTFLPVGSIDIPGVKGITGSLIRWGSDGLAFGTGGDQVFLIESPLFRPSNPIDDARVFVRRHYLDFLNREPDQGGWDYWTSQISQCGTDPSCIHNKRIDVSNAFFHELEYQQTGSYVYRLYRAAYGNSQPSPNPDGSNPTEAQKLPSYAAFLPDRAQVVGGASLAQSQLDFANAFVQRGNFITKYPANLDGSSFIDAVLATIKNDIGVDLSSQKPALLALFNSGGRGAVMYRLGDDNLQTNPINNRSFIDAEYNRAFAATQYFGYLRRDSDIGGFLFWLGQVNIAPLRDTSKQHAMVCSFITSAEYQLRFGSAITHSNAECPQ